MMRKVILGQPVTSVVDENSTRESETWKRVECVEAKAYVSAQVTKLNPRVKEK